ncbi:MAG: hypothetical protein ACREQ4_04420, partial [Candidatus Binataceae bacterium]
VLVRDRREASRAMAFEYDKIQVDDDDHSARLVEKNGTVSERSGVAITKRAEGSKGMMIFKEATNASQRLFPAKHGGQPASPNAKQPGAVISAQRLAAMVYEAMKPVVAGMNPESAADVLSEAAATAMAALRQAGWTITDDSVTSTGDPSDPSLHPREAQVSSDPYGRKANPASKGMTAAEMNFFKSLGMPGLTSIEKALAIGSDLGRTARRINAEHSGDLAKVLEARLDQPRMSFGRTSDSLLKRDSQEPVFYGSERRGMDVSHDRDGNLIGYDCDAGNIERQLQSAVHKSDGRTLDFSAVYGSVGPGLHVNRMCADVSNRDYDLEQRAEVEKSLRRRERQAFDSVEKLLN